MKQPNQILVIISLILSFCQAYAINHQKEFNEGQVDLLGSVNYLKSTSNFNGNGNIGDLPSGNYFQLIDSSLGAKYSLFENINIYAFGNVGSAESRTGTVTRSSSTFNKTWAGAEYLLDLGYLQIIPEVSFLYAIEKISRTQDSALNNEGVNEFTGKLNLQMDFKQFLIFGYGGYDYRDGGRSNLLPWGANIEYQFSQYRLGGELFGFQPITDDADKGGTPEFYHDLLRANVNGSSAKFYSINPSVTDSNIYLKYNGGEFGWWVAGGIPLLGKNYANGYHAEAGIRWSFGGEHERRSRVRSRPVSVPVDEGSRLSTDKKVEKFQEDTNDGVDQKLFRATPTPRPLAPAPVMRKPRTPVLSDQQIQNKMDNVEMQIELRSNKKKKKKHSTDE